VWRLLRAGVPRHGDPGRRPGIHRRSQIARSDGTQTGRGMATAGIVLGFVGIGLGLVIGPAVILLLFGGLAGGVMIG
jgi:hypothetical protein